MLSDVTVVGPRDGRSQPSAYLDNASTTPMRPEAVEAMLPYLSASFANPSGAHAASRLARRALDEARSEIADLLGCAPDEVVFTSGGTESDNLAVLGSVAGRPGRVLVSAVEHRAVLAPARRVGAQLVGVGSNGVVDLGALAEMARGGPDVADALTLVSVMLVNSETGVVQPVESVREAVCHEAPDALIHTDAVQALPWLDVRAAVAGCDLVSLSAHKFGGPKGVGLLVVRKRAQAVLQPLILGGGQELERRAGTENVAGAVATAVAARLAVAERAHVVRRVGALRDRLVDGLIAAVGAVEGAPRSSRVAGSGHLRFPGRVAEELLLLVDAERVAASTGSACASGGREPSHVLLAMGWDARAAREAVRFSLGTSTTLADVDHALGAVGRAVARLDEMPSSRAGAD